MELPSSLGISQAIGIILIVSGLLEVPLILFLAMRTAEPSRRSRLLVPLAASAAGSVAIGLVLLLGVFRS